MRCFLAIKDNCSSTVYSAAEAFFLGGILMCSDEHHGHDFVSLVRHNPGYANPRLLSVHRSLICHLAHIAGGEVSNLDNRRFEGFAVHFRSIADTDDTLLQRAQAAIENGDAFIWKAMLAGAFDGRASFDRKRGAQANAQFVVDCPLTNEREISELIVGLARRIGIEITANYCRERLQGGRPRKTQLRLRSTDEWRFFAEVGLVSPEKLQRAVEMYGSTELVERDRESLPGVKVIKTSRASASHGVCQATGERAFPAIRSNEDGAHPCFANRSTSIPVIPRQTCPSSIPDVGSRPLKANRQLSAKELAAITIGARVAHKKFGEGVITSKDDQYISVKFEAKECKFMCPGAFEEGFLQLA